MLKAWRIVSALVIVSLPLFVSATCFVCALPFGYGLCTS